jgi:sugar phosphate isomerase/epimerase
MPAPAGVERVREMDERLGLNLHRDGWPTSRSVAAYEEAGLRWLQVHVPPRSMLADRGRCRRHARALRTVLHPTPLRLVLHAPDDLSVATSEHDRAFDGMLDYAAEAGAEIVAYHGLNFADAEGPARARIRERAQLEERSLRGLLQRAHTLGVTVAIENLAPVHPAPPRLCHDPLAVRDLVRRLDLDAPGIDPLKLDLHLPPGRGCLPWARVAGVLRDHAAPLMLEVELSQRPSLPELTAATLRALASEPQRAAA